MKKIILSLAGVMAATAFAPQAAAVPAFARQAGMACTACHAQHFPILNTFGRSFKASGYTIMGAQGKVEGEHLSIPDTLNTSIVMKIRYQKDNSPGASVSTVGGTTPNVLNPQTTGDGQWQFFDEFALLIGGRVADNIGFLLEAQMIDQAAPLAAGFKMPFAYDMGGAKLSVVPFTTDALDVTYGYELSSGGVQRANRWSEHRRETSAIQWNADRGANAGAATGVTLAAQNDLGYVSFTKWNPQHMMGPNGVSSPQDMDSNYFRIAATPTVGDWATVIGVGRMSGTSTIAGALPSAANPIDGGRAGAAPGMKIDTDQTFFDAQAQGEVGGKELGVYFQYAKAPATANCNAYNSQFEDASGACRTVTTGAAKAAGTILVSDRKAWTIGADYSVIPHVLSIGVAYRNAKTGSEISAADAAAGRGVNSNAITLTAVYDLYQNVALHLNYSKYNGNDLNRSAAKVAANDIGASSLATFMLEAAW